MCLPVRVSTAVSLDSILQDVRSLEKGMEVACKEFLVQDDNPVLKDFIKNSSEMLDTLIKDSKTAQVSTMYLPQHTPLWGSL